jgi:hypothetical protein
VSVEKKQELPVVVVSTEMQIGGITIVRKDCNASMRKYGIGETRPSDEESGSAPYTGIAATSCL